MALLSIISLVYTHKYFQIIRFLITDKQRICVKKIFFNLQNRVYNLEGAQVIGKCLMYLKLLSTFAETESIINGAKICLFRIKIMHKKEQISTP